MIQIPDDTWRTLLDLLTDHPVDHERIAYLDGVRTDRVQVVTTVTVPDARTSPGSYTVPAEAMSQAGAHLRQHGLVRIAQVHTHPGTWVGHSPRDDEMAYSQRPGAVSLVLPEQGRERPLPTAPSVGIHVRRAGGWTRISPAEATSVIGLVPSVLDHRRPPCQPDHESPIVTVDRLPAWRRWIRARLSRFTSN